VAIASGKHPVSIPNLEVKLDSADGTATGRSWESRTPPDIHTVKGHPAGVALNIYPEPFRSHRHVLMPHRQVLMARAGTDTCVHVSQAGTHRVRGCLDAVARRGWR
jgi:hypothetical protein